MNNEETEKFQKELKGKSAEEILQFSVKKFENELVFASALGAEDQVITDIMNRLNIKVHTITLDTGRLFEETYQLLAETEKRYNTRFQIYFPNNEEVEAMISAHGINLFHESVEKRKLCCKIRKINPLKRALSGFKVWLCGLRREQSVTRNAVSEIAWDGSNNILKINPLVNWTEKQVWDYITANNVPYNKLHDKGYPSIGCACCTRAVKRTEDLRAGRWWWELPEQKECGLHLVDGKLVRKKTNII